jgi:hypothetical protein
MTKSIDPLRTDKAGLGIASSLDMDLHVALVASCCYFRRLLSCGRSRLQMATCNFVGGVNG